MQAVILAAGESSRFWPLNKAHKSLTKIMGKTIIEWTVESLRKAGISDIIVIQDQDKDIEKAIGHDKGIKFLVQKEAKGMGNAILQAEKLLKEHFFVLNPNHTNADLFINLMKRKQKQRNSDMVLLAKETDRPWEYGILELEGDLAKNMVEKPEKGKELSNTRILGIYLLPSDFLEQYKKLPEHMYSYEDTLRIYMQKRKTCVVKVEEEIPTLKYPWDLLDNTNIMLAAKIKKKKIHRSVKMAKNVIIEGDVEIGENTRIFENSVIKGPCYIGKNCVIGDNSIVRENTGIEDNVVVGANCEITRSIIQEGTHLHAAYVGDSVIGKNCRIGAGFISGNVKLDRKEINAAVKGKKIGTGLKRLGVITGDDTKFGIGVRTMPGVMIGSNCIIGPASVIFENVPDNTKFYTKFENVKEKTGE